MGQWGVPLGLRETTHQPGEGSLRRGLEQYSSKTLDHWTTGGHLGDGVATGPTAPLEHGWMLSGERWPLDTCEGTPGLPAAAMGANMVSSFVRGAPAQGGLTEATCRATSARPVA